MARAIENPTEYLVTCECPPKRRMDVRVVTEGNELFKPTSIRVLEGKDIFEIESVRFCNHELLDLKTISIPAYQLEAYFQKQVTKAYVLQPQSFIGFRIFNTSSSRSAPLPFKCRIYGKIVSKCGNPLSSCTDND